MNAEKFSVQFCIQPPAPSVHTAVIKGVPPALIEQPDYSVFLFILFLQYEHFESNNEISVGNPRYSYVAIHGPHYIGELNPTIINPTDLQFFVQVQQKLS